MARLYMQSPRGKNMHTGLWTKMGSMEKNEKEYGKNIQPIQASHGVMQWLYKLQISLGEDALLLVLVIFWAYKNRINAQTAFCMCAIYLHHRELEFGHLI